MIAPQPLSNIELHQHDVPQKITFFTENSDSKEKKHSFVMENWKKFEFSS